jgi:hypothetical protein
MKKIIIVFLITITLFLAGCSQSVNVTFIDEVTGKVITPVLINGKEVSGAVKLKPNTYKVSANLYEEKTVKVDSSSSTFFLKPIAYLVITPNATINSIEIDGKVCDFVKIIQNGKETFVVSPVEAGTHKITIKSKFFIPYSGVVSFSKGENALSVILEKDTATLTAYLDTLEFPLDNANKTITIKIKGTANKNPVNHEFSIQKKGDTFIVQDGTLTYTYKNGSFEIEGAAPTEEEIAILQYAKSVIEEFLNMKELLKTMDLKEISDDTFTLSKAGLYEGRTIYETVSFKVNGTKISQITLNIFQEQINTNLTIEVEVN